MVRVQLIGEVGNSGISRDLSLLSSALRANGCAVSVRPCGKPERRKRRSKLVEWRARVQLLRRRGSAAFNVNVMLEHIWPQFMAEASLNVVVPNPEWFDTRDQRHLPAFDCVWVKTEIADRLFRALGCSTSVIGFDSEDRGEPGVQRMRQFLHVAGRSPLKGTARLLALWQRHPEWPTLTLVQDPSVPGAVAVEASATNIVCYREYLSDAALRALQNAHRFHVCTSEAEGWGHYIVEAMSVGAVTLTCDAAPMNELIVPGRGLTIAVRSGPVHNLVQLALFDEADLEETVRRAMALTSEEVESISRAARDWFSANKTGFVGRVGKALAALGIPAVR